MYKSLIFYGDIYQVTKYETKDILNEGDIAKVDKNIEIIESTWLVKLKENEYIRLADFQIFFYLRKLFPNFLNQFVLKDITPYEYMEGKKFIKENHLTPYYKNENLLSLKKNLPTL